MTIYILHESPEITAQMLDDKSLEKQIKDISQVLQHVHKDGYYKNYINEWAIWARECKANYLWLVELGLDCTEEWEFRFTYEYGKATKHHKLWNTLLWARENIPDLPYVSGLCGSNSTVLPLIMPKKYLTGAAIICGVMDDCDAVLSYRNYYESTLRKRIKLCQGCCYEVKAGVEDPFCSNVKWTKRDMPGFLNLTGIK